ncbi:MAG TPA: hypothetical protein DIU37_05185 [Opitutae bacterium]|nr:hypothetical protein [Opitutae bacterium]|tara:strand:+ start:5387 stop:6052 length:666 start_codon:yes stop_codon:yes gene_type:complete
MYIHTKKLIAISCGLLLSLYGWCHTNEDTARDEDVHSAHEEDYSNLGLAPILERMDQASQAAFGYSIQYFGQHGELPSGNAIQQHLDNEGHTFSEEELEELLVQTSAGSYLSPNMNRMIVLGAAALSYFYPQVWPVTFFFLLYDHTTILSGAQKYFGKGTVIMYGFMTAYFWAVVHQANQGVHEFRKFLQKHGYDAYWMWGVGAMISTREYMRHYGLPFAG